MYICPMQIIVTLNYSSLGTNDKNKCLYLPSKDGFVELGMVVDIDVKHPEAKAGGS